MSEAIADALEEAARKAGKGLAEDFADAYHSILKDTEDKAGQVADNVADNEADTVNGLTQAAERPGDGEPGLTGPRADGGAPGSEGSSAPGDREPDLGAGAPGGGQGAEGNSGCTTGGDPVDVVSGQMITSEIDLSLPGLLPLVLRRAYASGYPGGTLFGPGWSSTLTERVQVDRQGIHYAGDDGQILHYPVPSQPGQQVLPERGARWPLTWDRSNDTILITDTRTGWTRHFPAPFPGSSSRPITILADRNGHRIHYLHDEFGVLAEIRHSGGYRIAVDHCHTAAGPRVEALRLLDGTEGGVGTVVRSFGYDARGRLTEVVNSTGLPFVYTYDDLDRIVAWTDRNGHGYAYVYGADGRVSKGCGSEGVLATDFVYDPPARTTTVTDSLGYSTVYCYDEHGHVSSRTDPLGHTVRTEHDRYGRLLSHQDALGRITGFILDEQGNPVRVDRPDGNSWSARYTTSGLPLEVRCPDGATWLHTYDDHGNRIATIGPAGASTFYRYDDGGRLTEVTDGLGHSTRVRCNQAGLTLEVTNPLGASTRFLRDAFGRPVAATDVLGGTSRFSWTIEGRLSSRTAPDGSVQRWSYDAEGNPSAQSDQVGATTRREYGPFNRLTATTGADGARHTFAYDTELRLVAVTNPDGLTWKYDRDPIGRVVTEHDFNRRAVTYVRDAADRLLSRTNGVGQVVAYTYDNIGNLLTKTADGTTTRYIHDSGGRIVGLSSPTAEISRAYDETGRLIQEIVNGRTLSYTYDLLGRRATRTTPSGHESAWAYDGAGRPLSLTAAGHIVTFDRDLMGRETVRHLPGELEMRSEWDGLHRLTGQRLLGASRGASHDEVAYTYRSNGHLAEVCDLGGSTRRFSHDPLGRVTAIHSEEPSQSERYSYDATGNLLDAHWPATAGHDAQGTRSNSGTLVRAAGRTRFEHDAQGRVTARRRTTLSGRTDVWTFSWDAEDHLTGVVTPSGDHWRYLYDPFGRRIAKQRFVADGDSWTMTEWTDFTWDATTLAEQTSYGPRLPGSYTCTWDHQGLQPIAQTEHLAPAAEVAPVETGQGGTPASQESVDRRFFAIMTDLVGTPIRLLNLDGSAAWQSRTTLWGVSRAADGASTSTPLRFPGQYYDPETRLNYNVHRYYDPAIAGYLSPDPLGLLPSPNPHAYVSNPLQMADPLGLAPATPPPLGEHSNPFPDRDSAERAAFQLAGIPYGSPADLSWEIGNDPSRRGLDDYMFNTEPTHWGNMRQYETPQGSRVIVEHTDDPAGLHFHAGMPKGKGEDAKRNGVNFGWGGSDPDKDDFERYQKIDKPGGDHHLFYQGGTACAGTG